MMLLDQIYLATPKSSKVRDAKCVAKYVLQSIFCNVVVVRCVLQYVCCKAFVANCMLKSKCYKVSVALCVLQTYLDWI